MAKFKAFWNYQKKKTGEIVIAEEIHRHYPEIYKISIIKQGFSRIFT